MVALSSSSQLAKLFRNKPVVKLAAVPRLLRLDEVRASELVASWVADELAEVWEECPSGVALVPTTYGKAKLDLPWETEPPTWKRLGRRRHEVLCTDVAPDFDADLTADRSDYGDPVKAAEREELLRRNPNRPEWAKEFSYSRPVPITGLCAPWDLQAVERAKWARPRLRQKPKPVPPCPVCLDAVQSPGRFCLVCDGVAHVGNAPAPDPTPVEVKAPAKFRPRIKAGSKALV